MSIITFVTHFNSMLIIMDGERNHSMGSPKDRTPHSPKTNSDHLMKDKSRPLLSVDL